jgi:DNA-binding winged helix-turn-helix (wHTH) protein
VANDRTRYSGKSNLVRFLLRRDVQAAYGDVDSIWFIAIDTHALVSSAEPAEYLLIELMIHRLIMQAESRGVAAELLAWMSDLHMRLISQPHPHLALRYLDRICGRLCETLDLHLVFIFDQFDDIWRTVDTRFFLNLRSLRDEFKYQIVYLVMTRERLQRGRADLQAAEAFWELFSSHVYGLGMYSESDAQAILSRLASRRSISLTPEVEQSILRESGGHPALQRAVFWALSDADSRVSDTISLLKLPAIAEECAKIWDDLAPEEQQLARTIVLALPERRLDESALRELRLKGIIKGDPPVLFSPLFETFILQQRGADTSGIVVNPRLRQVWVDGQPLNKQLSRLEFALLEYLVRHAGSVVSRDRIMLELYQQNDTDERLDNLVRRLRDALGEDARNPRYLLTHRGAGVQIAQGRIEE